MVHLHDGCAISSTTSLDMGMNRKARRNQKKAANKSRSQQFYDAINDKDKDGNVDPTKMAPPVATGGGKGMKAEEDTRNAKFSKNINQMQTSGEEEGVLSSASLADAPGSKTEAGPELTTVVVDEQTGFERIAQGKAVMDVVTRQAVKLSDLGPMYRMAQFSPGVPPEVREKHRFNNWESIEVPDMVDALQKACEVDGELPEHPKVSNDAIDFVIANRDLLGFRMKKCLGRLKMRAQSQNNEEEARSYRKLWKHFLTLEDHISAPFRQMVLDGEEKVGPNFGNLDVASYANGDLYERASIYVVLKAMVAHWEKKVRDADFVENTPQDQTNFMEVLATGDPKRYVPNPPIIFRFQECVKICAMAQQMTATFVNTTSLFDDLPVELRFIESALTINGGTSLRKFIIEDFCPKEDITPEALREGMRRFYQQMENMQIDPYGDFTNVVAKLCEAMAVGTEDQRDPYAKYLYNLDKNGPGYFQTYTFNFNPNSMVAFLDKAGSKKIVAGSAGPADDIARQLGTEFQGILGLSEPKKVTRGMGLDDDDDMEYIPPKRRSLGRPHNMGWLDLLEEDRPPDDGSFESDNW
eukprot:CAMPEP_0195510334 /NCGR_PEP_ID=MMETSP0794_2-20130614/3008_1 /TAXON_ID=515487 /ORGANISM="Stephanopyxis turris, Strain CCMP 815" /LENGTH=581 /DNA_ID=CAMNT_0040637735 /DNA_START=268 /DNA_END=2011 /DNA_ORIENTATION=-